jgi:periplasmic copper chaperone A
MRNRSVTGIFSAMVCASLFLAWGPDLDRASAQEGSSKGVTIAQPWVRATPGGSTLTAAFMEIKTGAGISDKLVAASSPSAGRVEVHTHIKDGDIMKMRRVETLELKPGETRIMAPSGDHVMLFDLKAPLKVGDVVKLTLTFEKAGPVEVEAKVEPIGAMGPNSGPNAGPQGVDAQPGPNGQNSGSGDGHHHH